jgi:hypothetical protein
LPERGAPAGSFGFKASKNSAQTAIVTTLWFATNRRGGNTMLLHRTLNPIIHPRAVGA